MTVSPPALLVCDCVSWRLDLFEAALDRIATAAREWDTLIELRLAYRLRDDIAIIVIEQGLMGEERLGELAVAAGQLPGLRSLTIPPGGPTAFDARDRLVRSCDVNTSAMAVTDAVGRIRNTLGMTDDRRRAQRLAVDVACRYETAGGWTEATAKDLSSTGVFIATRAYSPDIGDRMRIDLFRGTKPVTVWGEVVRHTPDGFGARLMLDEEAQRRVYERIRILRPGRQPRGTPVRVPVNLGVSFQLEGKVRHDEVENLSQQGAFIRTEAPPPAGTALHLDVELKKGDELGLEAQVVRVVPPTQGPRSGGFGVTFRALNEQASQRLDSFLTESAARPLARVLLGLGTAHEGVADGLTRRRCEVITATTAQDLFSRLLDELLSLDLLVLPDQLSDGPAEELLHRIRKLGGELDLPVVVVSARPADGQTQLAEAGATAVFGTMPDDVLADRLVGLITERRQSVTV